MKTLEQLDYSVKSQNIDYFVHLIRIAIADDVITSNEMELLQQMGEKLGFTPMEIQNFIETTGKADYLLPLELSARFEQVYEIVKMILADGLIDKNEIRLASSFASKIGFKETEIPNLLIILINGIKQKKELKDLFESFTKRK